MSEFPDALYNTILLNQSYSIISNKTVPYRPGNPFLLSDLAQYQLLNLKQ